MRSPYGCLVNVGVNNPFIRMMVRQIVENEGYWCPEICSPEELLEAGE